MNKTSVIQAIHQAFSLEPHNAIFTEYSAQVWHVEWDTYSVCVRFTMENQFAREMIFLQFASVRGWAPTILASDPNKQWLITEWLPGRTLQSSDYHNPTFVQSYLQQLRVLHQSSIENASPCVPTIQRIYYYLDTVSTPFSNLRQRCDELALQLQQHPLQIGTIHNDLHAGNAIINREKIAWIDWSEAGVGDVGNDLAEILIFFPREKHFELVELYFSRELTSAEKTAVHRHCQLRYGLCAAWAIATANAVDRNAVIHSSHPEILLHQVLSHEKSLNTTDDYYQFALQMMGQL